MMRKLKCSFISVLTSKAGQATNLVLKLKKQRFYILKEKD